MSLSLQEIRAESYPVEEPAQILIGVFEHWTSRISADIEAARQEKVIRIGIIPISRGDIPVIISRFAFAFTARSIPCTITSRSSQQALEAIMPRLADPWVAERVMNDRIGEAVLGFRQLPPNEQIFHCVFWDMFPYFTPHKEAWKVLPELGSAHIL